MKFHPEKDMDKMVMAYCLQRNTAHYENKGLAGDKCHQTIDAYIFILIFLIELL